MAAGLGFKTFATGEVLTAADANGYLMSQTVMVFANAAARTSAIASPQQGMITFLKDSNLTQYYSGSAWVAVGGASPLTTKGDLYTYSTTDARLAVGSNGQYLKADSTAATGLTWGGGGGMTLISTTTLSGSSTTISSIPSTYKNLELFVEGAADSAAGNGINFRMNGDTGTNHYFAFYAAITPPQNVAYSGSTWSGTQNSLNGVSTALATLEILDYANTTTYKVGRMQSIMQHYSSTSNLNLYGGIGAYRSTSAISSIQILPTGGTLSGTAYLYGVA
jgi:hypothetical protein